MSDSYSYLDGLTSNANSSSSSADAAVSGQSGFSSSFEYSDSLYGYETAVKSADGSPINILTPVYFFARIWDRQTGLFFTRDDFSQIKFTLYKVNMYSSSLINWISQTNWTNITLPLTVVEAIGDATWKYDNSEYNFIYFPSITTNRLFENTGNYYAQTKFWLTNNRLPLTITHSIKVV